MTREDWTVVARSNKPGFWSWQCHWSAGMLRSASDADTVIAMHRRTADGWEIVARLATPAWQRFQRRLRSAR